MIWPSLIAGMAAAVAAGVVTRRSPMVRNAFTRVSDSVSRSLPIVEAPFATRPCAGHSIGPCPYR